MVLDDQFWLLPLVCVMGGANCIGSCCLLLLLIFMLLQERLLVVTNHLDFHTDLAATVGQERDVDVVKLRHLRFLLLLLFIGFALRNDLPVLLLQSPWQLHQILLYLDLFLFLLFRYQLQCVYLSLQAHIMRIIFFLFLIFLLVSDVWVGVEHK